MKMTTTPTPAAFTVAVATEIAHKLLADLIEADTGEARQDAVVTALRSCPTVNAVASVTACLANVTWSLLVALGEGDTAAMHAINTTLCAELAAAPAVAVNV